MSARAWDSQPNSQTPQDSDSKEPLSSTLSYTLAPEANVGKQPTVLAQEPHCFFLWLCDGETAHGAEGDNEVHKPRGEEGKEH